MLLKGPCIFWIPLFVAVSKQETNNTEAFSCLGGSPVIPITARCDSYPDCPGGEDEHGCGSTGKYKEIHRI